MCAEGGAGTPVRQWRVGFYEYSIMEGAEGPYVEGRATGRGYSSVIRIEWAEWKRRTWGFAFFFALITSMLLGGMITILSAGGADSFFGLSVVGGSCVPILIAAMWVLPSVYHTYKYAREHAGPQ